MCAFAGCARSEAGAAYFAALVPEPATLGLLALGGLGLLAHQRRRRSVAAIEAVGAPVRAAVQPGPEPDREDVVQGASVPAAGQGANAGSLVAGHRRRPADGQRHRCRELVPVLRVLLRMNVNWGELL